LDNINWMDVNITLLECGLFLSSSKNKDRNTNDRFRILQERLITNRERTQDIADDIYSFKEQLGYARIS
jgi:hypothetical protein